MNRLKKQPKVLMTILLMTVWLLTLPFAQAMAETDGSWEYTAQGSEATVTAYTGAPVTEVLIPKELGKCSVTAISGAPFSGCPDLTKVTVQSTVTSIEPLSLGYTSSGEKIENFTIGGDAGSAAETYANENGFAFKKIGLTEKLVIAMTGWLEGIFGKGAGDITNLVIIFLVSMLPLIELRGGLIAAALLHVNMWVAIPVCLLGNLLPVPFILWLITPIFNAMKKTKAFRPMVEKLEKKSMGKSDTIQKYEFWGLVIFVGIPLPGTGAWTGSLIASLLNIKVKKAFPAVCLGMVMAAVIMCIISYGIPYLVSLFA